MLESISCNVCESKLYRPLYKKKDPISNCYFKVVMCSQCGLGYVNPRPSLEEMKNYYQKEYYVKRFDRVEGITKNNLSILFRLYNYYWRRFSRYYPDRVLKTEKRICNLYAKSKGKLLDIGCANGDFLKVMEEDGFEVYGLEFSDHFINKYGFDIFEGNLLEASYSDNSYNLITMWAVLEHVYDPMGYLKEISKILRPGGIVIFLVPNLKSIPFGVCHNDDIPRHLYVFSPQTVKRMLKMSNLKLKAIIHNNSIFYGGIRGCLIQFVLRSLGFTPEKIDCLNRPIVELLTKSKLGLIRYFVIFLSLVDAVASFFLTPVLCILRYNGIIVVVAEKQSFLD